MKWFLKLPVESALIDVFPTSMGFDVNLTGRTESLHSGLTVGDLLGQSPHLNIPFELKRTVVVFSAKDAQDAQRRLDLHIGYNTEDLIRSILDFFPMLQDLVQEMKANCNCHQCQLLYEQGDKDDASSTFNYDANCLG